MANTSAAAYPLQSGVYIWYLKYKLHSIDINKSVAYELRFNEYFFVLW